MLDDSFPVRGVTGIGYDQFSDTIWTMGGWIIGEEEPGPKFRQYDREGNLLVTLAPPHEEEDWGKGGVDFPTVDMSLGGVDIQAGTMLFTYGGIDTADVYALSSDGTIISTLRTEFGASGVEGLVYSETRGTIFLIHSRITNELANKIAEIDVDTGEVINIIDLDDLENEFRLGGGDPEIDSTTGNLLIGSYSEKEILQLTPEGLEISRLPFTDVAEENRGVIDGMALDETRKELYLLRYTGDVFRYSYGN